MTTHFRHGKRSDTVGKLASYSAAAALGAFGAEQAAEGAIVYTDLEPDAQSITGGTSVTINLDNAGYHEASIINISSNVQIRSAYGGTVLTSSGTYYVQAFNEGDTIGPAAADPTSNIAVTTNYNFVGTGRYIGVKFDIGGNTHYGWMRMDVESTSPTNGTIYDYAYEDTPDTAIIAGAVPEPGTLALLAIGAGALALPKRRCA